MSKTICFDYDGLLFKACCAVEKRSIIVKHKNGFEKELNTRTEFYGNWRKKDGGWLASKPEYSLEDFEIEDVKVAEPLENALALLKRMIKNTVSDLDADHYYGYLGGVGNFRKDICTLLPYKGNRTDFEIPVHLGEAKEYLLKHHNARVSNMLESDDLIVTDMHSALQNKDDFVGVVFEKDYLGCSGDWYYPDQRNLINIRGFGELIRTEKKVTGQGRMFKYFQVAGQDSSDNYAAACFSDKKNGEVSVYNRLKDCKNDKEAFTAMKEHFLHLYPEPKEITNWKGDTFEIDWFYVMQECFNMAHLQRWKDDRIDLKKTFDTLGVQL